MPNSEPELTQTTKQGGCLEPRSEFVSPTNLCLACGAPFEIEMGRCPYDVSESHAPWRADYQAMARGQMTHAEHLLHVARWIVHNAGSQNEKTVQKMGSLAANNRGRALQFFKLDPQ